MATIVCQGLQSCLESQLVESRTLRLRLSSPKPQFSQSLELASKPTQETIHRHNQDGEKFTSLNPNPNMGGWSFLQVLQSSSKESMENKDNVYVHPLMKRYPSTLSEKSLELCTENLGCETGSDDILENTIFSSEVGNFPTKEQEKPRQLLSAKKANSRDFPPPLTTMRGSESLRFRPHREDGRLIIKAVKAPSSHSCFQAERSHGRLRLCFVKDSNFDMDSMEENEEYTENDMNYEETEEEEEEETEQEEDDFEIEEEEEEEKEENTEENNLKVGEEIGKEEFQRPSRCKEGELENTGLLNWERLWVATS